MAAVPVGIRVAQRLAPHQAGVSLGLARWLGVPGGAPVAVRVGRGVWPARVRVFPAPGLGLWLPPAAARALHVPAPITLWARRGAAGSLPMTGPGAATGSGGIATGSSLPGAGAAAVLDLGPVVGILARQYHDTNRLFVRLARARGVLAFLFGPQDVAWGAPAVWGRVPRPRGRGWLRRPFPFPHVVFDRAVGVLPRAELQAFLARLAGAGSIVFNGDLGDKWAMHQHLLAFPRLRSYLPETRPLDAAATLRAMLARWGTVYVKPADGCMGRGIVRVEAAGGECLWSPARGPRPARVPRAALDQAVAPWIEAGGFLVQQGLDLVRVGGGVCDVRILALKDGRGRWRMVAVTVRRARPGQPVSNLHQGGRPIPFWVLARRVPRPPASPPLRERLRRLVEDLLPALDARSPQAGDVGIDIGVDRGGRLWILEVNPKPGRSGRGARAAVYTLPMDYARWLAGFAGKESGGPEANPAAT
ncbi:MAG TPA: YheC/YheD family protein [Limnochordales bacterium]|nr:YheC/YheD family protein [Limnochordales bacterium]